MIVLIGSSALKIHGYEVSPKDIDLVGTYDDIAEFIKNIGKIQAFYPFHEGKKIFAKAGDVIYEGEIAWPGSSAEDLIREVLNDTDTVYADGLAVPSLNFLYMLKMSHRYLKNSPHFHKTMDTIQRLRKDGAVILDKHQDFYRRRMKATYDYGHPKLNTDKKTFFVETESFYKYDHDTIHEAVKVSSRPAYKYYQEEDSQVQCSKELWDACDREIKLYGVYEEACVLALERSQIPYDFSPPAEVSFVKALEKVCTSITSGWFREFAWENYNDVMALYRFQGESDYVNRFKTALLQGVVKPFKEKLYV